MHIEIILYRENCYVINTDCELYTKSSLYLNKLTTTNTPQIAKVQKACSSFSSLLTMIRQDLNYKTRGMSSKHSYTSDSKPSTKATEQSMENK